MSEQQERIRVTAEELRRKWMSMAGVGLVHDHATEEIVVRMDDGTEYACTFADHAAALEMPTP